MNTTSVRKQTSLRLDTALLDMLKEKARESHQSLNSYVEHVLMDIMQYSNTKKKNITETCFLDTVSI